MCVLVSTGSLRPAPFTICTHVSATQKGSRLHLSCCLRHLGVWGCPLPQGKRNPPPPSQHSCTPRPPPSSTALCPCCASSCLPLDWTAWGASPPKGALGVLLGAEPQTGRSSPHTHHKHFTTHQHHLGQYTRASASPRGYTRQSAPHSFTPPPPPTLRLEPVFSPPPHPCQPRLCGPCVQGAALHGAHGATQ